MTKHTHTRPRPMRNAVRYATNPRVTWREALEGSFVLAVGGLVGAVVGVVVVQRRKGSRAV